MRGRHIHSARMVISIVVDLMGQRRQGTECVRGGRLMNVAIGY